MNPDNVFNLFNSSPLPTDAERPSISDDLATAIRGLIERLRNCEPLTQ